MKYLLLLCITSLLLRACYSDVEYLRHTFLSADSKYSMWWKIEKDNIIVKLRVATTGWIGWGVSLTGRMAESDMVLFWFNGTGAPNIVDAHALGQERPVMDKEQDYSLVEMTSEENHTIVIFHRKLQLCDPEDVSITSDTMRIIWAYGETKKPSYHMSFRGSKSLFLLAEPEENKLPNDVEIMDLRMSNTELLEQERTLYKCNSFGIPKGKRHVVRIEPIIQEGNEKIVHHILLYGCNHIGNESYVGVQIIKKFVALRHCGDANLNLNSMLCKGCDEIPKSRSICSMWKLVQTHMCKDPRLPYSLTNCRRYTIHGWAIGGSIFNYPENVGLAIGGEGNPEYLYIEIHYDNPTNRGDIKDNSGLRLFTTKTLRLYEASPIVIAVAVGAPYMIIPQKQQSFQWSAFCSSQCLNVTDLKQYPKIFASLLHTHLTGHKILVKLVRDADGVEVETIAQDLNYDFNFQEMRRHKTEIEIPPEHSIRVECSFNTAKRIQAVLGGFDTRNEMCLATLWTYPSITNNQCGSKNLPAFGAFQKQVLNWTIDIRGNIQQDLIIGSKNYKGSPAWKALTESSIWENNPNLIKTWEEYQKTPHYTQICEGREGEVLQEKIFKAKLTESLSDSGKNDCHSLRSLDYPSKSEKVIATDKSLYTYFIFSILKFVMN